MNRRSVERYFERIGARVTIRKGTGRRLIRREPISALTINVTKDSKGEHFTMTVNPDVLDEERDIEIQLLDYDKNLRQMLLLITTPQDFDYPLNKAIHKNNSRTERLLVGHDEMHWFVAGVSEAKTIKEAFERLRPKAVTLAFEKSGDRNKNRMRRRTKGFIRQGEWFFVPVHFIEDKMTIIHKNEPISRTGGTPHIVEELVRTGGKPVYVHKQTNNVILDSEYNKLPKLYRDLYEQRRENAKVLARGKIKHRDHHTVLLKGWHEVFLSTERTMSGGTNAFID
jgi:hypothetical protein